MTHNRLGILLKSSRINSLNSFKQGKLPAKALWKILGAVRAVNYNHINPSINFKALLW